MIIQTSNPDHFKQIAEFVPKVRDVGYSKKEFLVWFLKNYDQENYRVWIDTDEDKKIVKSFVIAQIVVPLIDDEIFIPLSYVDPTSSIGPELLRRVEEWAKSRDIKAISIYIKRGQKAFEKKYGFTFQYIGLIKRLT